MDSNLNQLFNYSENSVKSLKVRLIKNKNKSRMK